MTGPDNAADLWPTEHRTGRRTEHRTGRRTGPRTGCPTGRPTRWSTNDPARCTWLLDSSQDLIGPGLEWQRYEAGRCLEPPL